MDNDLSGVFITSVIELKLDTDTLFEWQRHSQTQGKTPHYYDLKHPRTLRPFCPENQSGTIRADSTIIAMSPHTRLMLTSRITVFSVMLRSIRYMLAPDSRI